MTEQRPVNKPIRVLYSTPKGYDYDLGKIAFGETPRQERIRISNSMKRENYQENRPR